MWNWGAVLKKALTIVFSQFRQMIFLSFVHFVINDDDDQNHDEVDYDFITNW